MNHDQRDQLPGQGQPPQFDKRVDVQAPRMTAKVNVKRLAIFLFKPVGRPVRRLGIAAIA